MNRAFFTGSETVQNPEKKPVKDPVNFHSVFYRVENVKTCEQGIFHRDRTCEKPSDNLVL